MAIRTTLESKADGKVTIEIDNGHLEALNKITTDFKIDGIEKALGFVIAVISKSNGKPIKVGEDTFVPGEAIRVKEKEKSESTDATQ